MRSWWLTLSLVLCLASPLAARKETVPDLLARVQAAAEKDRPRLYIKLARLRLEDADHLYHNRQPGQARAAVEDIVGYADQAYTAADHSGKRLKDTEISIRKIADKLRDIRRGLEFEDQAPVQAAVDHLEELRTKLLTRMFGKGAK